MNDSDKRRAGPTRTDDQERLFVEFDAMTDGIWDWNLQTGEVIYSDRWLQSLGYDREDAPPHISFVDGIIHPDDKDVLSAAGAAHLEGDAPVFECEYRMRRRSGTYRWTLGRGRVVERDSGGSALRVLGTNYDIETAKQSELLLAENEERSRMIVETAGCVIVCLDRDFRVLEWNRAAEKVYGWTRAEVRGKPYVEWFIPDEVRERVTDEIRKVLGGGDAIDYENPVIARDGQERLLLWNAKGLADAEGKIWGVLGIGQDITEQRQAERQTEIAHREMQVLIERFDALRGLLDICSVCKKIRDGDGNWSSFDEYMLVAMEVEMSHGFCPTCYERMKRESPA